jgi:hypothetical protein
MSGFVSPSVERVNTNDSTPKWEGKPYLTRLTENHRMRLTLENGLWVLKYCGGWTIECRQGCKSNKSTCQTERS